MPRLLPCEEAADTAAGEGEPKPPLVDFLSALLLLELLRAFMAKSEVAKLLQRDNEGSKRNEAVESREIMLTMR
jgi:hypothetical protein